MIPGERERGLTARQELWTPLFPARTTRRLRYSTNFAIACVSGAVATQVFSANGLYDPDITGTGHQPMGFDQMMLSYNHYTVTNAAITCTMKNSLTSVPTVAIFVSPSATPITVIDTINEFGMLEQDVLESKGVYGSNKILKTKCSIRKVQGVKDVIDVTDLSGTAAANPVEQTYFHVQCWDATATTGGANVDCVIEYTAIFSEPRVLSPSLVAKLRLLGAFDEVKECRASEVRSSSTDRKRA